MNYLQKVNQHAQYLNQHKEAVNQHAAEKLLFRGKVRAESTSIVLAWW